MFKTLIIISLFLLTACSSPADVQDTRFIMGTLVKFTVVKGGHDQDDVEAAISSAANEMQRIEDMFTIYGKHPNAVKSFNASMPNTPIVLPDEVNQLLERSLSIQQQSNGAFSPVLGAVNLLWGFSGEHPPSAPPSADAIRVAMPAAHCIKKQPDGSGLHKWSRTHANCQLDFGAIAKGYAIDQGIKILKAHGMQHAIINAGGDIRLIGKHGERAWHIGIRHPRKQGDVVEALNLQGDVSIVTSGDYERFFIYKGKRYHHLINPETGWPATSAQSATIIASSATLADAWSTALFVQGQQGIKLQNHLQQKVLLIDHNGKIYGSLKPNPDSH
ncbi:MAG: FAD:protein FMN transferase [Mariprofundus sp.]|nr:FAD:protein FMN transferase [Mariprofundus sp.]